MSEIEKMERYISNTSIRNEKQYTMGMVECAAVREVLACDPYTAITLAFRYGRAKGYRAAKAGMRK